MKFRLYPTRAQETALREHCAHARFVWNLGLEQRNMYRKAYGPTPVFAEQSRQLTEARKASDWLNGGSRTIQQHALRDLDQAFRNWWSNPAHFGRPTWRRRGVHESFGAGDVKWKRLSRRRAQVNIPKIGWVDWRWSRDPGEPTTCRVKRDAAGRWWIAFAVIPDMIEGPGDGSVVGVDRGVAKPFVTSQGAMHDLPGLTDNEKVRLLRLQRKLARQVKGSNRREHTKRQIARCRHRGINRRDDAIEKLTTQLARDFDVIRIEDLNIKGMTRSAAGTIAEPGTNVAAKRGLNRSILESGWGRFEKRLEDKVGPGRVEKVPAAYTSQRCNHCGHTDAANRESQAVFVCTSCGHSGNADVNAAKNIAAGHAVNGRGAGTNGSGREALTPSSWRGDQEESA